MATTIGIFAHVDAGKTSLSEQILYQTGVLRTLGRVDTKSAYLDHDTIERERGITIFADEAPFQIGERSFFLIDTPGHVDFGGEMERSMCAIDCAILVISAVEGIQSHTATIWKLLRKNHVPTVIFLNKTDREGADADAVLLRIQEKWTEAAVAFDQPEEALREELATVNEELLCAYLENSPQFWTIVRKAVLDGEVFPVLHGSALRGDNIERLLSLLARFCYVEHEENALFCGRVYKVRHEKNGERLTFLKVMAGVLRVRDTICTPCGEAKIHELRQMSGQKSTAVSQIGAGALVAVKGLADVIPGDIVGKGAVRDTRFALIPLLSARVYYPEDRTDTEMLRILRELEEEEPLYHVSYVPELHEIHVRIAGEIQLEILAETLEKRYGVAVRFGECDVVYHETIAQPVIGCGHFEPLRHYAEVHLRIEPAARGSGLSFASECPTDVLALHWQRLIETHVMEKAHRGVLVGAPLCDVKIVLLTGRAHLKHTEGGDFREATYRAIRQGLMQAENILLEPWLSFEIEAPPSFSGRILTDIQTMQGRYEAPHAEEDVILLRGSAPARALLQYARTLQSQSSGKARAAFEFDGYFPCTEQERIVAERGYDPERDVSNSPDSVFCSHGAGYTVKWYDAPAKMHCPLPK